MRILYFTRDYTTHDRRFLAALAKTEHKVYYLRLEREGRQLEDRPLPSEIEMVSWSGGTRPVRWQDGPRLLSDLKRVITKVRPDLVQAGPIQTSALLTALSGFSPLVSMSWGSDLLVDSERNAWYRWATGYTLRRSSVLVGDCNPVRQKAREFGMPDERIVTFPWGVDLEHFTPPAGAGSDPSTFTLLSTRSWEPIYGVDVIARAFVEASRRLANRESEGQAAPQPRPQSRPQPRPQLRLVMLGGGSQAGLLRQIFLQGGVSDRVYFPGLVTQADLPRFYRSADLYVAASHSDGTSISLLEAMACARPVLVSDIPGNREWVEPGVQGWLFPDGDVQALARSIVQAVDEAQRLPEMGRAAHALARQRADWKQNFQKLLRAYEIAK